MILLDIAPVGAGIGIGLAIFFFLICLGVAFFAFKTLKKTVKMAVRMVIVAVILFIAVIGSIALLLFGYGGGSAKPERPAVKTTK